MFKHFSDWLARHEALFRFVYRLLLLAGLGYGLLRIEFMGQDIAAIADQMDSLAEAISDMQDSPDEETAQGTGYHKPGPGPASADHPVHRRAL